MIKYGNELKQIVLSLSLLLTGCASVAVNTYQDGKTLGKGTFRLGVGGEMSPMKNYGLFGVDKSEGGDPTQFDVLLDPADTDVDSTIYFWWLGNLLMQYGATDNIDIGIMPFTDILFNYGAKAFLKYGVINQEGGLSASVVPYFGWGTFAFDDTSEAVGNEWELKEFAYNTTYWGLDVPVGFSDWGYVTLKFYQDKLNGEFTYHSEGTFEPSLDVRTSFGVNLGLDTPGEYGRIEAGAMYEKTPQDDWVPRFYIGYNKFFTFGGD